jgi:hypothetical protein
LKKRWYVLFVVLGGALLVGCAALLQQTSTPTELSQPPVPLPDQTPLSTSDQVLIQPVYFTPTPEVSVSLSQPTALPPMEATSVAPQVVVPPQTAEEEWRLF